MSGDINGLRGTSWTVVARRNWTLLNLKEQRSSAPSRGHSLGPPLPGDPRQLWPRLGIFSVFGSGSF